MHLPQGPGVKALAPSLLIHLLSEAQCRAHVSSQVAFSLWLSFTLRLNCLFLQTFVEPSSASVIIKGTKGINSPQVKLHFSRACTELENPSLVYTALCGGEQATLWEHTGGTPSPGGWSTGWGSPGTVFLRLILRFKWWLGSQPRSPCGGFPQRMATFPWTSAHCQVVQSQGPG